MPSAADYPYNPNVRSERLHGLEKLRAIESRSEAQALYELWFDCQRNERSERFREIREQRETERYDTEVAHLQSMAAKAFDGAYGVKCRQIAERVMSGRDAENYGDLCALRQALRGIERLSA